MQLESYATNTAMRETSAHMHQTEYVQKALCHVVFRNMSPALRRKHYIIVHRLGMFIMAGLRVL